MSVLSCNIYLYDKILIKTLNKYAVNLTIYINNGIG